MQLSWTFTLKKKQLRQSLQCWIGLLTAGCSMLAASAETHPNTEGLQKQESASSTSVPTSTPASVPTSLPNDRVNAAKASNDSPSDKSVIADEVLTPNAKQLAEMLDIVESIEELRVVASRFKKDKNKNDALDLVLVRQKLSCSIQYAALELEEALANIDGELGITNMQYAYFSSRNDHSVLMNNVATFVSSGTLGVLDSSTGIKSGAPLPNIFGITGNSLAIGIPMLGLRAPKYKNPSKGERKGNMLAPVFGRTYAGSGYDPIVWTYLEAVPAQSKTKLSRRQTLLKNWQAYRQLSAEDPKSQVTVDQLIGISANDAKTSLNLLKTRSEMLLELRGQVQQMYKDISDLNTGIMAIY